MPRGGHLPMYGGGQTDGWFGPVTNRLDGLLAVVTGAAGGQGFEVCRWLAAEGADVLGVDVRSTAGVTAAVQAEGRRGWGLEIDLGDRAALRREVPRHLQALAAVDVLVCCAGLLARTSFEEVGDEEWDRLMAVNLRAPFVLTQLAWPYLQASRRASVVYITSKAAISPTGKQSAAYVASKGGLQSLVYAVAMAGAPHGIRANGIAPGAIATPMLGAAAEQAARSTPLGRVGSPKDIAAAVGFLASADSGYVTGTVLSVSGGRQLG
jgi:NAD(P)-dependent dehydrogenase (short-subunit alcohol dehydrogenase family)